MLVPCSIAPSPLHSEFDCFEIRQLSLVSVIVRLIVVLENQVVVRAGGRRYSVKTLRLWGCLFISLINVDRDDRMGAWEGTSTG